MGEKGMKTTSRQKNPHEDDYVVSPTLDKDAIVVNDREKEAVDQLGKKSVEIPTIMIFGSTQVHVVSLELAHEKIQEDDDVDFDDLSTFDEILSASYAIPDKEIPTVSGSEVHKSLGNPSSSVPTPTPLTSFQPPPIELPVNLLSSISTLLNNPLDSLVVDGKDKQSLIDNISSLSKAVLPSAVILVPMLIHRGPLGTNTEN